MKKVIIYKLQNDGSQKEIATCVLDGGLVEISGEENFTRAISENGIRDYTSEKTLFPKDGIKFLEQLKYNFKSGYLNATDIIEE